MTSVHRGGSEDPGLRRLCESYCDLLWNLDPVEGASAGVTAHAGRLGSFTAVQVQQHVAALRSLQGAVEELDLPAIDDEIDRTALVDHIRVAEHRWRTERPHERDPGLWVGQVLEGLQQPLIAVARPEAETAAALLARLAAVPDVLRDAEATLVDCPRVLVEAALAALEHGPGLVADVEGAVVTADRQALAARAEAARAAMQAFAGHLQGLLRSPGPPEPWGVGAEALTFRLRHEHALAASTEDLLRHAGEVVAATERDLTALARALGAKRWQDAAGRIEQDALAPDEIAGAYRDAVGRIRAHVEAHQLLSVPEGPLEVVETPAHARPAIPVAAYLPPGPLAPDRTGRLFVTAGSAPGEGPARAAVAVTVAHEAIPGHHVHFLTLHDHARAVRRFLYSSVTIEGWALHAEAMLDDTGGYAGLEERFWRLLALRRRALRIPLDVGIHTHALSYEAAVRFAAEHMLYPRAHAEAEVRRTCAQPGAQLAYAAGYREMTQLRETFGSRFPTVGAFHDAVLAYGGLPVSLIRWGLGRDA